MTLRESIDRIEKAPLTLRGWVSAFLGILFIRYLLEAISTRSSGSVLAVSASTVLHYTFFYLAVILAITLIISLLTGKDVRKVTSVAVVGMMAVWLAPILDLMISGGSGFEMAYLFQEPKQLFSSFMTFFGPMLLPGATIGVRIEIGLIILGIFLYATMSSGSVYRGLLTSLFSYVAIFTLGSLPSVFKAVHNIFISSADFLTGLSISNYFRVTLNSSLLAVNFGTVGQPLDTTTSLLFNIGMAQLLFVIASILCLFWFWRMDRDGVVSIIRNSRPERVAHYMVMTMLGILLAVSSGAVIGKAGLVVNVVMFMVLALSLYTACLFAIGVNDIVDIEVDRISNPERPLIAGEITVRQMTDLNVFFLIWSLLGAYLVGWHSFFFLSVFTAAYYVYSAPPLQLKRVPGLATFLISLACLAAAMMGFFAVSADKSVAAFPAQFVLLLIIVFTLGSTVKDIKDIKGDAKEGVKTLPVMLGEKNGKRMVGLLVLISFWLVPIILISPGLYILAFPFGLAGFYLVNRKRYQELPIFVLYFLFFVLASFVYSLPA